MGRMPHLLAICSQVIPHKDQINYVYGAVLINIYLPVVASGGVLLEAVSNEDQAQDRLLCGCRLRGWNRQMKPPASFLAAVT